MATIIRVPIEQGSAKNSSHLLVVSNHVTAWKFEGDKLRLRTLSGPITSRTLSSGEMDDLDEHLRTAIELD